MRVAAEKVRVVEKWLFDVPKKGVIISHIYDAKESIAVECFK
ncbi:MAG: hypothetical protein ABSH22_10950 [Tepidisphaeraceae bacterium]